MKNQPKTYQQFAALTAEAKAEYVRTFAARAELVNPSTRECDWLTGAIMHALNTSSHWAQIRPTIDAVFA